MSDEQSSEKRTRLARNGLYGLLSWVLPAAPSLIVTPVIVRDLGVASYGLYVAILGITGYFFTTIIGKIAAKYVAEHRAAGDDGRLSGLFTAIVVVAVTPTIVSLSVLVLGARYIVTEILRIEPSLQETAVKGLWLAGVIILFSAITQAWQSALQGLQRFDTLLWVSNASSLCLSIGLLIIAIAGGGVLSLLEWAAVAALLTLCLSVIAVLRAWPQLKLTLHISREDWRHVTVYASSVMVYQLFGVVILLFERAFVIQKFGIENAAFYLVPMNLALLLLGFTGSLLAALFPTLNEHLTDKKLVSDLYRRATKLLVVVVTFAGVAAAAVGKAFLTLWLGGEFAERSSSLLVIHTITFSIMSVSLVWWQFAEAYRRAPVTAYANFAAMLVTLPLMVLLGNSVGLNGVGLARLSGLVAYLPLWFYVEHRFAGGFGTGVWVRLAGKLFLPCVGSYLVMWSWITYLGVSWPIFVSGAMLGAAAYLVSLSQMTVFDRTELAVLQDLFSGKTANARI